MAEEKNESLTLVQKLAKIRAMCDVVKKDKQGYNYSYADITEILAKITAGMKKYGVSLYPYVSQGTVGVNQNVIRKVKTDKTGKTYENVTTEMLVTGEMLFKWVNDDNPDDFMEFPWFLTGSQEDPSQAYGSAITYCTRYFLTSFFQIAQDNDVDKYRSKQKEAEASEDKAIADELIAQFDKLVRAYLADHEDKKDEVIKFIGRYVKKSDYTKIKEPTLAAKLLNDFKTTYGVTETEEVN